MKPVSKDSTNKKNTVSVNAFTLVELIVVITILAVLATVGFLALSGYTKDASSSAVRANLKTLAQAVSSESAKNGDSPRRYIIHSGALVLSGATFSGTALIPGPFTTPGTNYSAGTADFWALRADASKFKNPDGTLFSIAALDLLESLPSGKTRSRSFFQIGGFLESGSGNVAVEGTYPTSVGGSSVGLIASSSGSSVAITDSSSSSSSSSGGGGASDPYYANVLFLTHLDAGVSDQKGHTTTAVGNAVITAWQAKFWAWSAAFDGTWDAIQTYLYANNSSNTFGTGAFTMELWTKVVGTGQQVLFGQWNFSRGVVIDYNGTNLEFGYFDTGYTLQAASFATAVRDGNWHHLALVRENGSDILKMYEDGVLKGSKALPAGYSLGGVASTWDHRIGGDNNGAPGRSLNGYVDEVRVTKGIARYTADFSASLPTSAFPDS